MVSGILVVCVIAANICEAGRPCDRILAEHAYQEILKAIEIEPGELITETTIDSIERYLIVLGSIRGKEGVRRLVKLARFYIGEGTGEILSQIIVERRKDSILLLEEELRSKETCNAQRYSCSFGRIKELIDVAKRGIIYGSGESLTYLSVKQLNEECAKLAFRKGE